MNKKLMKWYIAIYSVFCINIPMYIMPESVRSLEFILGEKIADNIYDYFDFSEHSAIPFLAFCAIFTVFMLFFAYRLKVIGVEKTALIVLANMILPYLAFWSQNKTEMIILIVIVSAVLLISYTIQTALNISIKISVAKENKTEAEASE